MERDRSGASGEGVGGSGEGVPGGGEGVGGGDVDVRGGGEHAPLAPEATRSGVRRRRGNALRLGALALLAIGALLLLGRTAGGQIDAFIRWVEGMGTLGAFVFVAGYAAATVAFVPGSLLTMAAGAVFGIWRGVALVFLGAVLGSTAAFLVGRYVARGAVERRIRGDARFEALDRNVEREGLKLVFLLRLTPVMPYNLLNYALGVTRVRLSHYVLGAFGMLPGTLLYVYSGRVAGDVATALGGAPVARGPGYWIVLGLGLVATIVVTVLVTRMARAALRAEVPEAAGGDGVERGDPGPT